MTMHYFFTELFTENTYNFNSILPWAQISRKLEEFSDNNQSGVGVTKTQFPLLC